MRVALTLEIRRSPHREESWQELFEDCLWLFEQGEALGFDSLLVQEHFFNEDGYAPSMPAFLAALCQRTSTARIGSYIYIAPLHHPAQLAQETAVLDQLSGGRLDVALGSGHRVAEYLAFGLNPKTRPSRMEEAIEILKLAWTGQPFSYEGRYYDLRDLVVKPEPLQQPHPPLWLAATAAAPAERAGRHGLHLAGATPDPEVHRAYREALAAGGHDPAAARISNPWSITVTDEDPEAVWERNKHHYHHRWDYYRKIRAEIGDADLDYGLEPGADAYRANELIGDAETVLATLEPFVRDLGLTDIVLFGPHPWHRPARRGLRERRPLRRAGHPDPEVLVAVRPLLSYGQQRAQGLAASAGCGAAGGRRSRPGTRRAGRRRGGGPRAGASFPRRSSPARR